MNQSPASQPSARQRGLRTRQTGFHFRNLPISYRLPLLMGTLLIGMSVVSIWAAYSGVRTSALEVGRERLQTLTQQLSSQSQQTLPTTLNRTATVAGDEAVRRFLATPSTDTRTDAIAILNQFYGPQDQASVQVELWDSKHKLALIVPNTSAPQVADPQTEFKLCRRDPFKAAGSIQIINNSIVYPIVAAVKDGAGNELGCLIRWRRVSPNANARKQIGDLLGSHAALYYGNLEGDVWTDLDKPVPKPPGGLESTLQLTRYQRDGNWVMAMGRPIVGTPWFLVVEIPEGPLLSRAHAFLRRSIFIGVVLLAIGLTGAFVFSRSITRPLHLLTKTASAIRAGDYSQTVKIDRLDELGTLAKAFNAALAAIRDAQEQLEQRVADRTAQLEAANKELEAFSYSVSHDLRAPLRHINGFSQALLEDNFDQLDDTGKNYLQEVRHASQEMGQLIDDVLQLARVTRSEMRREDVNLTELARSVIADLEKGNGHRPVNVNVEDGLSAQGDKRLLRIVLVNLLGNAWKFTSQQESAEISFGRQKLDGETVYFVRDNGAGFDMAYVGKLFGAFQRLHSGEQFEGTGIGLATVQRIVRRHGGHVRAEGKVDQGATFYFTLSNVKENGDGKQSDLTS